VRVGADDQVARQDVPVLHQHQVGDAGVDVPELLDAVLSGEGAAQLMVRGGLGGLRRRKVIHHHRDPVGRVERATGHLLERLDTPPACDVAHI